MLLIITIYTTLYFSARVNNSESRTHTFLNYLIHTITVVFNITDRRAAFADINRTAVYSNIPSFGATAGGKR